MCRSFSSTGTAEEDLERWDRVYYVGAKAFESGIMQGEIAADAFGENPMLIRTSTVFSSMWC